MKENIIHSLKELVDNRLVLVLSILLFLLAVTAAISIGISIKPSEFQLISHYSAFGITNLYRDQWYYLFVFVIFVIFVALLHIAIAIKLLIDKGRPLAIAMICLGIGIVFIGWATSSAILNVWTPLV